MPILLVSLGTSWPVVPEAFHLLPPGPDGFSAVHVLTTASTKIEPGISEVRAWFASRQPNVVLSISRVDGFNDLQSEAEHFAFEEVLFRWLLAQAPDPALRYVCLAGGFKTMSAAMQRAATLFGAAEVFHVLADPSVNNAALVDAAVASGAIRFIRLGAEAGWPQLKSLPAQNFPLDHPATDFVRAPGTDLGDRVARLLDAQRHLATHFDEIGALPFPSIALISPSRLAWLRQPFNPAHVGDLAWLQARPKIELHCHLGGFATHGPDLAAVRAAASNPAALPPLRDCTPPADWPTPPTPCGLEPYRQLGDNNGSALLRDPGCLRAQCERLYAHFLDQNIVYAEVRCSPANYASPGRSPFAVLSEIRDHFQRCMDVAAGVPPAVLPAGKMPASTPDRSFHPFSSAADFSQTWRDLPHRDQPGATVFLTFRLADSLPADRLATWYEEQQDFLQRHPKPWDDTTTEDYRRRFPTRLEGWLDEAHGTCALREAPVQDIVEQALRHFDGERYILDAYVVMPNHVHVLVKPLPSHNLRSIVQSWKSYTAKQINAHLGRSGTFWQEESFDHLVRCCEQLERLREYIAANPRQAGLHTGFRTGRGLCVATEVTAEVTAEVAAGVPPAVLPAGKMPASTSSRFCHVNLLIIATRQDRGDFRTAISRHLTLAVTAAEHWTEANACRVVGVDLAGFEDPTTRAHYFRDDFKPAHRCNLALTVHAGENDDSEGIWSAVLELGARRLGHALALSESQDLLRTVADRAVAVEMCPYANLQIKGYPLDNAVRTAPAPTRYPLLDYLRAGVRVTVNTDNIGISAASLTDNLILAARLCPDLTRLDLLQLQRHALDAAFVSPSVRVALLERMAATVAHI